jgi:hypothetical protein
MLRMMRPDDLDAEISPGGGGGGLQSMLSQHQLVADAQMEFGGLLSEYRRQQAQQVPPQPEAKMTSEARAPQPAQQPPPQQPPQPAPAPAPQPEAVADSGGQAQHAWSGGPLRTGSAVDVLQQLRQQEDTAPSQQPLPSQHAAAGQWAADPSGGRDVTAPPPPAEDEAELDGSSRMSALQDEHARWQEQMSAEIAAAESRQRQPSGAAVTRGGGSGLEEELDSESVWRTRSGGGVDNQHHDSGGGGDAAVAATGGGQPIAAAATSDVRRSGRRGGGSGGGGGGGETHAEVLAERDALSAEIARMKREKEDFLDAQERDLEVIEQRAERQARAMQKLQLTNQRLLTAMNGGEGISGEMREAMDELQGQNVALERELAELGRGHSAELRALRDQLVATSDALAERCGVRCVL